MDVCRMTQAYRQHPGMRPAANKRSTSSPNTGLVSASSTSHSAEDSHVPVASHHHQEQNSHTGSAPSSPTGFSLASMLPEALASALSPSSSPSLMRASIPASSSSSVSLLPGLNMGEFEAQSLLLRSMPMFGGLISRD
ncbi:hypothetical protein BGW42_000778 [Actinomortierella wolfii]|nr:hypothetical protein BGW42_000778 [Actinomortierella wolfii]